MSIGARRHSQLGVKRRGSAHDSFWRAGLTCVEAAARRGISGVFLLFSDVFPAKLTMPAPEPTRDSIDYSGGDRASGNAGEEPTEHGPRGPRPRDPARADGKR